MGRYTSFQAFTDQNTKLLPAYPPEEVALSAGTNNVAGTLSTTNGGAVNGYDTTKTSVDGKKDKEFKKVVVERVSNPHGSCAGASSSDFDRYRQARNREIKRLQTIDETEKRTAEEEARRNKLEGYKLEAEERTRKNAEKRKRKKMKLMNKKKQSKSTNSNESSGSSDEDEEDEVEQNGNSADERMEESHYVKGDAKNSAVAEGV